MGNLVREIRKEVNFSIEEYLQIQNLMEQGGYEQFSPFARGKLLEINHQSSQQLEEWKIFTEPKSRTDLPRCI